jgi:hypothetical protein
MCVRACVRACLRTCTMNAWWLRRISPNFHEACCFCFRSPYLCYLLTVGVEVCYFSLDHTQTHTTVCRTPLGEGLARRRDLYLTTHKHSQETNIHALGGVRTHDPSKRSAADLRFRRRGHWHWRSVLLTTSCIVYRTNFPFYESVPQ